MLYTIGKRILDIIGAIIGIILFSPIMLLAAVYVKLVSPRGPAFADIPNRLGKDGKTFKMYKIRSMWPNAHEKMLADPVLSRKYRENNYKLDPDPRLLPGAKLMRKLSIDEMPQVFNILKGDMSLVGPRAYFPKELEEQAKQHPETIKYIEKLKTIKPGLTGPWQVGGRSEVAFPERAKIDANYADNKSLLYDLWIIIKTPIVVFSGKGAY